MRKTRGNATSIWSFTVASVFLATALCLPAALAAQPQARVSGSIEDVGVVAMGDEIVHTFVVHNDGQAPLKLTDVKASCGCAVASFDQTIAGGSSGKVRVTVDTKDFRGPIAKSVKVFTNDGSNPELNLVIKADIQAEVEVQPGYARFIVVQGEKTDGSRQTIWAEGADDFAVLDVKSPYSFVSASHSPATEEGRWNVDITLARNAPVGPLADFVVVRTSHPTRKVIKIPLSGFVRPVLAITPRVADFGSRVLDEPYEATLEIKNLGSSNVNLLGADVDLAGVEATIEPLEEGRSFNLVLRLLPEMQKGDFRGTVRIRTTSKKQPSIEVDFLGTVL